MDENVFFREKKSQSDKSIFCTFIVRKVTVLLRATFGLGRRWHTTRPAGIVQSDWHFLETQNRATFQSQPTVPLFVLKTVL